MQKLYSATLQHKEWHSIKNLKHFWCLISNYSSTRTRSKGSCAKRKARPTLEEYNAQRETFVCEEASRALGADVELNERELLANKIIMAEKAREYKEGLVTPCLFKPSQHFFSVLAEIGRTPLFKYISMMPKGGALHAHDTALCSTDYLLELTYRENLWVCEGSGGLEAVALRFAKKKPTLSLDGVKCNWKPLSRMRKKHGAAVVDAYLCERFTLYPTEKFRDINDVWQQFMRIFILLDGLITYAPVWADYYYKALVEFQADGVQYLEFRTVLPKLYDIDGKVYTELDTVCVYKETLDKFMAKNPNFIGSKLIYAPLRNTSPKTVEEYIRICIEIKKKYPDFFAGFDVVGQEELGRPLKEFIPQLLAMPDNIDFYFHAGETNWYGTDVDENLIDAVLLGTKRIGHGFALLKHPQVLQTLKERNIPVEINPISNQVLQLVSDYRNHPCAPLLADNYNVVISSDDPSLWSAKPLSHDFYIAFLGIASAHADLRLLKKLAMNSLEYSAMKGKQLKKAQKKWQKQWDAFIENLVECECNE